MAVELGVNAGFVTTVSTSDPEGASMITIDNRAAVIKDTTPLNVTKITEVGWWASNATEEANYEVGLYDTDGWNEEGEAGTLLYSSTVNAKGTSAGWKTAAVDWDIEASSDYWIGLQVDNTATATQIDTGNYASGYDYKLSQTSLTNPFNGGAIAEPAQTLALYAKVENIIEASPEDLPLTLTPTAPFYNKSGSTILIEPNDNNLTSTPNDPTLINSTQNFLDWTETDYDDICTVTTSKIEVINTGSQSGLSKTFENVFNRDFNLQTEFTLNELPTENGTLYLFTYEGGDYFFQLSTVQPISSGYTLGLVTIGGEENFIDSDRSIDLDLETKYYLELKNESKNIIVNIRTGSQNGELVDSLSSSIENSRLIEGNNLLYGTNFLFGEGTLDFSMENLNVYGSPNLIRYPLPNEMNLFQKGLPMDLTTWTTSGEDVYTITSNKIVYDYDTESLTTYPFIVKKYDGIGDFEHKFEFEATSLIEWSGPTIWAVDKNSSLPPSEVEGPMIQLSAITETGTDYSFYLVAYDGNNEYSDISGPYSLGTKYFITTRRISNEISAEIRVNNHTSEPLATLVVNTTGDPTTFSCVKLLSQYYDNS